MSFQSKLEKLVNELPKTRILLIDGDDKRAIEAAKDLKKYTNLEVTLLVENNDTKVDGINVLNMFADETKIEEYANKYVELRKGKDDIETARKLLKTRPFYAMLMLQSNEIDGVVGGLNYSTADILRAAFKAVGPRKGVKTISSVMIMHKEDNLYFFTDISVNPEPDTNALVDISKNAVSFAKTFKIDEKVAFLSFSTSGSAKTDKTTMVAEATKIYNETTKGTPAIGEVQFDTAIDDSVRASKYKGEAYKGESNIFVFPNLESGNIGYKIAQRLGGYGAIGPIITGVNKPVNDLSRGSFKEDVVNTVLITAIQANDKE
ncbi:phosphate acetyltransferase [Mycoplasma tauri]|uniref:Phosphate acetyltransferase n=1 Tax=Mycoplasma tauri TaxID=547987 RepID=A0A953NDB0_9MOLU|nr:phosphate acetyltransferase [Mycoplasma tauri]MBZ4195394.1 phosphate acetyltransferase [Mycoplasma tauri]MBZ4218501.1 phosphate acetyltransferase [Mycoplasma tauri]QSB07280.1 phosphate acetyltransferase [Mycoplasma tauri]